jgi:hypothetical protein
MEWDREKRVVVRYCDRMELDNDPTMFSGVMWCKDCLERFYERGSRGLTQRTVFLGHSSKGAMRSL